MFMLGADGDVLEDVVVITDEAAEEDEEDVAC
jgi:hypothetical protein